MRPLSSRPVLAVILAGCLDPRVSDEVSQSGLILPASATVPSIYDTAFGAQIDASSGIGGTVPLYTGFAGGRLVHFWDLGPSPEYPAPLFRLVRVDGTTTTAVAHPPIFSAIPGDAGYSPYWTVFEVPVTAAYAGELITSAAAMNEAQRQGLLGAPKQRPANVDCPVVGKDVKLEVDGGGDPIAATSVFYYKALQGRYFDFGATALAADNVTVPTTALYELRREGGDPLSEPVRGVDLDGDGDTHDTNDIFAAARGDAAWSPRCKIVSVTVPAATHSIDTNKDEARADFKAASDLFDSASAPIPGVVLGLAATERELNCPQQSQPGGL